jgi:VanZ family protein
MAGESAGLLTRGSLPRRLPGSCQWHYGRRSVSPHSGGTVPDLHRVPLPLALLCAETSIVCVPSSRVSAWLPVLGWAAVIFAFSSIPHLGTDLGVWDTILRKGAHMTEYAILGALLVRALDREPAAFLAGIAYAVTDEIHQHFVGGRHASPVDVAIDSVGVLLGVLVFERVRARA